VSETASAEKNAAKTQSVFCCAWAVILTVVFLRLCIGWHFFNEGIKKFEYDQSRREWKLVFSAEGFLGGAKGPWASFFHNQAPTTHQWRDSLQNAQQLTPKESAKLNAWVGGYVKRRQAEIKAGKTTPAQFADFSPTAMWKIRILKDWGTIKDKFTKLSQLSDEQKTQAEQVYKDYELRLADFLAEEALAIETYQHDLWRLEQAQVDAGATEVPFEVARIAELQAAVERTPLKWVAGMKALDQGLADSLYDVLTPEQKKSALGEKALNTVTNPAVRSLERTNWTVAILITGIGVCLMLGLFTRVAAIAGALFLLSVMASQPPWVPGSMSPVPYYYQLVEFAAFLFLAAVGAGRWAGLDFIIHGLWSRRRAAQGA
jgi:uncharacterized membrane protein YphA (DoxX/SURF4 family)